MCVCVFLSHGVFSVQTLEGCEILLGPEVTYSPPGLDLLCPVAMTIAHCAEVDPENWNIQLKRKTQDSKWEVSAAGPHLSDAVQGSDMVFGSTWLCFLTLYYVLYQMLRKMEGGSIQQTLPHLKTGPQMLQNYRFIDFVKKQYCWVLL